MFDADGRALKRAFEFGQRFHFVRAVGKFELNLGIAKHLENRFSGRELEFDLVIAQKFFLFLVLIFVFLD